MKRIKITTGSVSGFATLDETPMAQAIWDLLPITARVRTWGDEIYFPIALTRGQEPGAREVVEVGDLGYWPPGHALCIFFGRTPASVADEARAASPVNVVGRFEGDVASLRKVYDGTTIRLEQAENSKADKQKVD